MDIKIEKVIRLEIKIEEWDTYLAPEFASSERNYKDIWLNEYSFRGGIDFNKLLDSNYKYKEVKRLLFEGLIDFIVLIADEN